MIPGGMIEVDKLSNVSNVSGVSSLSTLLLQSTTSELTEGAAGAGAEISPPQVPFLEEAESLRSSGLLFQDQNDEEFSASLDKNIEGLGSESESELKSEKSNDNLAALRGVGMQDIRPHGIVPPPTGVSVTTSVYAPILSFQYTTRASGSVGSASSSPMFSTGLPCSSSSRSGSPLTFAHLNARDSSVASSSSTKNCETPKSPTRIQPWMSQTK